MHDYVCYPSIHACSLIIFNFTQLAMTSASRQQNKTQNNTIKVLKEQNNGPIPKIIVRSIASLS